MFNPYLQILENSSRNRGVSQSVFWKTHPIFSKKIEFRGVSQSVSWKTHPPKFYGYLFSYGSKSGREWECFVENSSIEISYLDPTYPT